jgi:hypothetical protein
MGGFRSSGCGDVRAEGAYEGIQPRSLEVFLGAVPGFPVLRDVRIRPLAAGGEAAVPRALEFPGGWTVVDVRAARGLRHGRLRSYEVITYTLP